MILRSHEAALDLLERRSNIYSDKPRWVMARELSGAFRSQSTFSALVFLLSNLHCAHTGLHWFTALLPYGRTHKIHRKLLAHVLNPQAVQRDFLPLQERFSRKLANALLESPDDFFIHVHRYDVFAHMSMHSSFAI